MDLNVLSEIELQLVITPIKSEMSANRICQVGNRERSHQAGGRVKETTRIMPRARSFKVWSSKHYFFCEGRQEILGASNRAPRMKEFRERFPNISRIQISP